jgi:HEPN domain-containing protein
VFKALVEEHSIETQKIHKLVTLYGRIENFIVEEMDLQLLKTLDALYIEARYPESLGCCRMVAQRWMTLKGSMNMRGLSLRG